MSLRGLFNNIGAKWMSVATQDILISVTLPLSAPSGGRRIMIVDSGTGLPQVAAGTIRPLAMITPSRSALLPDLPTLNETVTPGFYLLAWGGLFALAGTPPEIITALAKACEKLEASAQFKEQLQKMGVETEWTGPEDLPSFLSSEAMRWENMVRDAGIEPQ
jgi:tripartite-type tricarboxylate transporter receptor subunit TctC